MGRDILGVIVGILIVVCVILGYSKFATSRPIIFEDVYTAIYDGVPYYQKNYGYVPLEGGPLVYFRAYRSLIANKAIVIFKAEKDRPIFSIIYIPGPGQAINSVGWVDDNCDGKFRSLTVTDKAEVPECYKED
jgi:hypothetical protein